MNKENTEKLKKAVQAENKFSDACREVTQTIEVIAAAPFVNSPALGEVNLVAMTDNLCSHFAKLKTNHKDGSSVRKILRAAVKAGGAHYGDQSFGSRLRFHGET